MDITLFPTKGNLMLAQNTLALSKQGYELLDKKTPTIEQDGERSVLDVSSLSPENRDKLEEYMRLLLMSQDR